ncbi:MAG: OprD family outer membrane porin [Campylobacterales bacterium]
MKTKIALSMALCASLIAAEEPKKEEQKKEAKTLEEAFKLSEVKGQIRAVYQSNSKPDKTSDTLIGGKLGIETAPLYGISVGATFYTSNAIANKKDFKDGDYYNNGDKDYTILGEAFAKYGFEKGELKVGRMELDTPFANSDDIRMIPNLFTAAVATYSPVDKLNLTAGVVTQMAGWENGGDHSRFLKMGEVIEAAVTDGGVWDTFFADNNGARESKLYMAGASYEHDVFALQAWYGRQTEIMDTYYLEASVKPFESDMLGVNVVGQYMNEKAIGKLKSYSANAGNEATKIDSNIYGIGLELESKATGLNAAFAYNKSGKKDGQHSNGGTASFFGGGKDPLLTSMDVETANGEGDIKAYKGEIGFDFEKVGVEGLSTALASAYFDKKASSSYSKETDLTVAYGYKNVNIEAMLSSIKAKDAEDNTRLRVFVKYDF